LLDKYEHRHLLVIKPGNAENLNAGIVGLVQVKGPRSRAVPVLARYQGRLLAAAAFAGNALVCGGIETDRRNIIHLPAAGDLVDELRVGGVAGGRGVAEDHGVLAHQVVHGVDAVGEGDLVLDDGGTGRRTLPRR
jgi:hypothetical protein